jgi:disulfide bond formation protein DsbB
MAERWMSHAPRLLVWLGLLCLAGLGTALVAQHAFGVRPCPWCVLQRGIVLLLGLLALAGGALAWALKHRGHLYRAHLSARLTAIPVLLLALCGLVAATYQHEVAAQAESCAMTAADRILTALDLEARFRLEGDVAVLYTGQKANEQAAPGGLARVQTMAGGVAHIRIGEQFLDIYSQRAGAVIHLPAIGVLLGGTYGSDVVPPHLAAGSDGEDELDTLRLIARILKGHHFQLYIPHTGAMVQDKLAVMERLAADVAYLHGLRRVIPALVERGESWEMIDAVGESLLPAAMQSAAARAVHTANLRTLATRA